MAVEHKRRYCVAVVGGGFSGAAVLFHLLDNAPRGFEVMLIEPGANIGSGLAYSTSNDNHCLNVPAGRLGLDRENGFIEWLASQGLPYTSAEFVPRRLLGAYAASEVSRMTAIAKSRGAQLHRSTTRANGIRRDRSDYLVQLEDGSEIAAQQIVLATGHLPPSTPAVEGGVTWQDRRMVSDPWRGDFTAELPRDQPVLLVGTGLTAVDVVSHLRDAGHAGPIRLLSRRGLLPQPHRANEARPPDGLSPASDLGEELGLGAILRAVRGWVRSTESAGGDWRDVMASLRPCTRHLWHRLSERDRRQFVRHLQPFWDTHRHRVAPAVQASIRAAMETGCVSIHAGRLTRIEARSDGLLDITWQPRGSSATDAFSAGLVVNCTGPTSCLPRATDPLHVSLRDAGMLSADALGLGIKVDSCLRPIDTTGVAADGVYYVGPMLKAQFWETVAIPELRAHAVDAARQALAHRSRLSMHSGEVSVCVQASEARGCRVHRGTGP